MLRLFQRHVVDIFNLTTGKLVPCQKVSISEGVKNTSCFSFLSAQMLVYKAECIFDYDLSMIWLSADRPERPSCILGKLDLQRT